MQPTSENLYNFNSLETNSLGARSPTVHAMTASYNESKAGILHPTEGTPKHDSERGGSSPHSAESQELTVLYDRKELLECGVDDHTDKIWKEKQDDQETSDCTLPYGAASPTVHSLGNSFCKGKDLKVKSVTFDDFGSPEDSSEDSESPLSPQDRVAGSRQRYFTPRYCVLFFLMLTFLIIIIVLIALTIKKSATLVQDTVTNDSTNSYSVSIDRVKISGEEKSCVEPGDVITVGPEPTKDGHKGMDISLIRASDTTNEGILISTVKSNQAYVSVQLTNVPTMSFLSVTGISSNVSHLAVVDWSAIGVMVVTGTETVLQHTYQSEVMRSNSSETLWTDVHVYLIRADVFVPDQHLTETILVAALFSSHMLQEQIITMNRVPSQKIFKGTFMVSAPSNGVVVGFPCADTCCASHLPWSSFSQNAMQTMTLTAEQADMCPTHAMTSSDFRSVYIAGAKAVTVLNYPQPFLSTELSTWATQLHHPVPQASPKLVSVNETHLGLVSVRDTRVYVSVVDQLGISHDVVTFPHPGVRGYDGSNVVLLGAAALSAFNAVEFLLFTQDYEGMVLATKVNVATGEVSVSLPLKVLVNTRTRLVQMQDESVFAVTETRGHVDVYGVRWNGGYRVLGVAQAAGCSGHEVSVITQGYSPVASLLHHENLTSGASYALGLDGSLTASSIMEPYAQNIGVAVGYTEIDVNVEKP